MRMLAPALALSAAPLTAQSDPLTLRVGRALDGRGAVLADVVLGVRDGEDEIAPGMRADLTGLDGDPLVDITVLRRLALVMKDGRVYESGLR